MRPAVVFIGLALITAILWDAFETIILPRRVTRRLRPARVFFTYSWRAWARLARRVPGAIQQEGGSPRELLLGVYAPLALLALLALWAIALVLGFALVQWGAHAGLTAPDGRVDFGTYTYLSGVTFFTIGFGDVTPRTGPGRAFAVIEGATGFGFLALVIAYLPLPFGAFAAREVDVTLLDGRAGAPPSAVEFLRRHGPHDPAQLDAFLRDWERWAAALLESHLAYPVLLYFRSQHEHQSWLTALTMLLDLCALLIVGIEGLPARQARLTFAMARHVAGDLSQIAAVAPRHAVAVGRLPADDLHRLRALLAEAGVALRPGADADSTLTALRALYEPYVAGLADRLLFALPPWLPATGPDAWQTTAWEWEPANLPPPGEEG